MSHDVIKMFFRFRAALYIGRLAVAEYGPSGHSSLLSAGQKCTMLRCLSMTPHWKAGEVSVGTHSHIAKLVLFDFGSGSKERNLFCTVHTLLRGVNLLTGR